MRRKFKPILAFLVAFAVAFLLSAPTEAMYRAPNRDGVYTHVSTEEKVVALTFDDGPHPRYTPQILDILSEYGVTATFFQIGENIENYTDIARQVHEAGHEIGNHTYTHPVVYKISEATMLDELERTDRIIHSVTGEIPKVLRTPQGADGERIEQIVRRSDKSLVLWTIDTLDWKGGDSEEIAQRVLSSVAPGDIILFHDYVSCKNATIPALKKVIPQLIEQGYSFATVSELIEIYG